eukprot:693680-Prymnesium_polylepis.1
MRRPTTSPRPSARARSYRPCAAIRRGCATTTRCERLASSRKSGTRLDLPQPVSPWMMETRWLATSRTIASRCSSAGSETGAAGGSAAALAA